MTDIIQLAKGKLNDPILMEWALDRYRDARMGAQQRREAMGQAWFRASCSICSYSIP